MGRSAIQARSCLPICNRIVDRVAAQFDVRAADVESAFGDGTGLLLVDRNGAGTYEVHPINAGYRVMADAFEDAFAEP